MKFDLSVTPQFCIQNALKESLLETHERCLLWHRIHAVGRARGLFSRLVGLLGKNLPSSRSPEPFTVSKFSIFRHFYFSPTNAHRKKDKLWKVFSVCSKPQPHQSEEFWRNCVFACVVKTNAISYVAADTDSFQASRSLGGG